MPFIDKMIIIYGIEKELDLMSGKNKDKVNIDEITDNTLDGLRNVISDARRKQT